MPNDPSLDQGFTVDQPALVGDPETVDATGAYQPATSTEPACTATPGDARTIPGYAITGEIARGGMGRVLAGREIALDREVAIKVLLPGAKADRFITESKITARLPHPSIPPVYALGQLADGSPYLAMKLIRGQTLAALLENEQHKTKFLPIVEQIAHAVGFAHAQGIIHRDLKPANVMVGAFGEVQVMDWGLARDQKDKGGGRKDDEKSETASDPSLTQAGSIMGTPAYMSPEQARGEPVDARTDVFALGAILCELLTGERPWGRGASAVVVVRAQQALLQPCHELLDACGADATLISLTQRCLAAKAADRFPSGTAVAEAVAQYRQGVADRLRRAETDRATAETKAVEQRKKRRALLIASGVTAAVLIVGIVGTTLGLLAARAQKKRAENETAEKEVARLAEAEQKAKALEAAESEKKAKIVAETSRDFARKNYLSALDAFNDMVFNIQDRLKNEPRTQELQKDLLGSARKGLRKLLEEAEKQGNPDHTLVWSYFKMGDIERLLGNAAAARTEFQAGHDLAARLSEADPKNVVAQRDLSVSYNNLGEVTLKLGQAPVALELFQKSSVILQRLAEADARNTVAQRDLSLVYDRLGDVTLKLGQTKAALDFFQKYSTICSRLVEADSQNIDAQRDLSFSYHKLGNVAIKLGQTNEALGFYQQGSVILQRLAEADPKNAEAQRDLSVSYNKLGDAALKLDQTKEALGFYQQSSVILQRLAEADPKNAKAQRDLSVSYNKLGDVALKLGQTKEALDFYQKCLAIDQRLAVSDSKNAEVQRDISVSYNKLGDVTLKLGQTKEALDFFQKGLAIDQRLAEADPKNVEAQRDLSVSYTKLGNVTLSVGQTKEALDFYRKSSGTLQTLAEADPKNAEAQTDLFVSYYHLGNAEKKLGHHAQAAEWFAKGRAVLLPWHEKKLLVGQFKNAIAIIDSEITACGNAEKTIADLDFAFTQKPEAIPGLLDIRVKALLQRKKPADAVATADRFAAWAETQEKSRDEQRYNAACVFAQCAAGVPPNEKLIENAVVLLEKAKAGGYFSPEKIAHLKQDSDFAGIRSHPKFVAFVASLGTKSEKK